MCAQLLFLLANVAYFVVLDKVGTTFFIEFVI
jgi:hypothetical protein